MTDFDDDPGVAGLFGDPDLDDYPPPPPRRTAANSQAPRSRPRGAARGKRSAGLLAAVLLVILALVALLIGGGVYAVNKVFSSSGPADYAGDGTGAVTVQVHNGDSAQVIGTTLSASGVVKSTEAFTKAAAADAKSRSIAPGFYALKSHMSGASALMLLLTPSSQIKSRVTVPEGSTDARTLALIASHTQVKPADLNAALANPVALGLPPYANGQVQGFLFPDTYDVQPGTQAVDTLQLFTNAFKVQAAKLDLVDGAAALGMTPFQIVTVASLIEGEAATAADRPLVAEVIYNRLKAGMYLGLESTQRYALGGVSSKRLLQSQIDKAKESPYDTLNHLGLPPGPISNPGAAALTAALHPAVGNDIYFVTLPATNKTVFTSSESEFNMLQAQCQAQGGC